MMIGAFQITWTMRGTKGIFGSGRVEWLGGPIVLQQHLRGWNFRRAGTRATAQFGHFGHLAHHNLGGSDPSATLLIFHCWRPGGGYFEAQDSFIFIFPRYW